MKIQLKLAIILLVTIFSSCQEGEQETTNTKLDSSIIIDCNKHLTLAQVERHFTPPVAGRNYAYPNVAAHLSILPFFNKQSPLLMANDLDYNIPSIEDAAYDLELIYSRTFNKIAFELVYHDTMISNYQTRLDESFKKANSKAVYDRSTRYADTVVAQVLRWADRDMYRETRNYTQYTPDTSSGYWIPTAPDYMAAIEPNWNKIRPFFLDSASQFKPERPTEFNMEEQSLFVEETKEVLEAVSTADEERKAIANFWDCNPNISHHHGHMMYFLQKISPGGHWIHIGTQALEAKSVELFEGSQNMALLAASMHDAFIACWDEKYRSNYIRPETVIKQHIDKDWEPILQTPPFPEYPSGHSVVSSTGATILTAIYGPDFAFTDSTEAPYGLPNRSFKSFRDASNEAAISRLYGGIHFMPAVENGVTMGNQVGDFILNKIEQ